MRLLSTVVSKSWSCPIIQSSSVPLFYHQVYLQFKVCTIQKADNRFGALLLKPGDLQLLGDSQGQIKTNKESKRRLKGGPYTHSPLSSNSICGPQMQIPLEVRGACGQLATWIFASIDDASHLSGFSKGVHSLPCSEEIWSCQSSTWSPIFLGAVTPQLRQSCLSTTLRATTAFKWQRGKRQTDYAKP